MDKLRYGLAIRTGKPIDDAERAIREALAAEGFGVLTEIDVAAVLKAKLGVERAPYRILGACNPQLAKGALDLEDRIGLLLPCNVVLREVDGQTEVSALDPDTMSQITANPALADIAAEARRRLERALAAVEDR